MKRTEAQKRMNKILKQYLKPEDRSGIFQLDIPAEPDNEGNPTFQRITLKDELEDALIPYCKKHFKQADPTLLNQEPLKSLFDYTAKSDFCQEFRDGTADIDSLKVDDDVKIFLHNLAPNELDPPKLSDELTREQLISGFKIWTERTSTSPKGRHLRLYKAWIHKETGEKVADEMKPNAFFDITLRMIQISIESGTPLRR
eukprot:scaffold212852_cov28-Attheya_sp.AAC.1